MMGLHHPNLLLDLFKSMYDRMRSNALHLYGTDTYVAQGTL